MEKEIGCTNCNSAVGSADSESPLTHEFFCQKCGTIVMYLSKGWFDGVRKMTTNKKDE